MTKTHQDDVRLSARGVSASVSADCGFLTFTVEDLGRQIDVLHRAPWVGTDEDVGAVIPHLRGLRGDFFCAPFADASADSAPLHGHTANGRWAVRSIEHARGRVSGEWALESPAIGARVTKHILLCDGHPFVYQRHRLEGGTGSWPIANHAMISLPTGGIICTSPKRIWETPPDPQEIDPRRGRSHLAYPARSTDPARFPVSGGGEVDLRRYPLSDRHEDFAFAVEEPDSPLGWVAVVRPSEGDLFLSLKDARALPLSMFWHSNGGRHYAPWNSRHLSVLGIEEGVGFEHGFLSNVTRADMVASDQPRSLRLAPDLAAEVVHVLGQMAWPSGEPVASITKHHDQLVVTGEGGALRRFPVLAGALPDNE